MTRSHLIAWRKQLELRNLAGSTIRRKLSAVASLFDSLCERNAVTSLVPCVSISRSWRSSVTNSRRATKTSAAKWNALRLQAPKPVRQGVFVQAGQQGEH